MGKRTARKGTGITYVDHPVGHLAHAEPGSLTQLLFLVLAGVWVIRMAVKPILEIIGDRLWEFPSLPFWPLGHGGSRSWKRGDGVQRGGVLGAI